MTRFAAMRTTLTSIAVLTVCSPLTALAADGTASFPPKFLADGKIVAATNGGNPPFAFFASDGVTLQGVDIDVGAAIATALKTKLEFSNVATFAGLIPGIQSGRYPFAMASITDRKDREEKVDFVNYVNVGLGILVSAGNPKHIAGLDDLCGKTVAIPTGSVAGDVMSNQSKKCVSAGKAPITINTFPGQDQAQLQLRTGRADANVNDYPVVVYNAKESGGALEATAANFCTAPFGIAVIKHEPELVEALKAGLEAVIQSGEYAKILNKWDLKNIAIQTVTVNGASTQQVDPVCLPSQ